MMLWFLIILIVQSVQIFIKNIKPLDKQEELIKSA